MSPQVATTPQLLLSDVHGLTVDVRTSLRKHGRNAEADAGSSAGDDGGLAGDVHSQGAFPIVNENSAQRR